MPIQDFELQFLLTRGEQIATDVERALRDGAMTTFGIGDVRQWHARALSYLEQLGHSREAMEQDLGTEEAYLKASDLAESYGRLRSVLAALEASRPSTPRAGANTAAEVFEYDVFISYSDRDRNDASAIYKALYDAGRRAFMASKSLRGGDDFAERIRDALLRSRQLWLLVTPNSAKSDWVLSEWGAAWVLGRRIVPILLRYDRAQLPDRLQRLHTVDYHELHGLVEALGH